MSATVIPCERVTAGDVLYTDGVGSVVLSVDVQRFHGLRAARVRIETRGGLHYFDPGALVCVIPRAL